MLPFKLSANTKEKQAVPARVPTVAHPPPLSLAGECLLFGFLSGDTLYPQPAPAPKRYHPGAGAASPSAASPPLPTPRCSADRRLATFAIPKN